MYVGSQELLKRYDEYLLNQGYSIEELVDKASDCLLKYMLSYQHIGIFCGPGNNGADGLSLAIKLFHNYKDVDVFIFEQDHCLSQANEYYLRLCYQEGINIIVVCEDDLQDIIDSFEKYDVLVDAMFGFGLNSSPRGLYKHIIDHMNQSYQHDIIAVDIPTGFDCNSGQPYQSVVCSTQTITFTALKNGFLNPESCFYTGKVVLEILDVIDCCEEAGLYQLADFDYVSSLLKERVFDGHKGTYGRVALLTGCDEYKGAALLSTKSAVYSGTGIATLISSPQVNQSLSLFCPEATTKMRPQKLCKEDFDGYDALLIGCGLGLDQQSEQYVIDTLTLSKQPLVVDADALTLIASYLPQLHEQNRDIIFTPHMGEFARVNKEIDSRDILKCAQDFARKHHIILVLKGPYTIVTDGNESFRVLAGNKAMAAGGMGDTLSGIIVSLLGQGYSGLMASLLGVYIHGYAGDLLAEKNYTVLPSKLIEKIPEVMLKIIKKQL
jgi:yjeF C-terminal region, hydroxyethylthiazole kinase-related/yjeF N-terminal region